MSAPATYTIALPPDLQAFVEAQVRAGGYDAINDYIRDLIREAQKRSAKSDAEKKQKHTAQVEFEKLLIEGLDSPRMSEKEVFSYLQQQREKRRQKRAKQPIRRVA